MHSPLPPPVGHSPSSSITGMAGALSPTLQKGQKGPKPQCPDLKATLCWQPRPSPQVCKYPRTESACKPRGRRLGSASVSLVHLCCLRLGFLALDPPSQPHPGSWPTWSQRGPGKLPLLAAGPSEGLFQLPAQAQYRAYKVLAISKEEEGGRRCTGTSSPTEEGGGSLGDWWGPRLAGGAPRLAGGGPWLQAAGLGGG